MEITPMCRALALHEVFDAHGVGAGGTLPLAQIERAWASNGLRHCDLVEALAEARVTGEFAAGDSGDGACHVMLTERGFEQAQRDLSSLRQIEELIRAYAVLGYLRKRRPQGPAFGRRRDDRLDS